MQKIKWWTTKKKSLNKDRTSITNASAFNMAQHGTPLFQDRETEGQSVHYTLSTARFFKADAGVCGNSPRQQPSVKFPVLQEENLCYEFETANNQSPWGNSVLNLKVELNSS